MKILKYDDIKLVLFCIALFVLFTLPILHKDIQFSEAENRYLEQSPRIELSSILDGEFMKKYEKFVTDQFPGRNFFTGLKTTVERIRGREDDNGVFFGKDNYLIGKYGGNIFEGSTARKNLVTIKEFIQNHENTVLGMVPTSSEILYEKLPRFAPTYNQTAFISKIVTENENLLDLGNILKQHREEYIYYKTDHHWTTLGAYYSYRELIKKLGKLPYDIEHFNSKKVTDEFFGTYDSKVSLEKSIFKRVADSIEIYTSDRINGAKMKIDGKDEIYDSIYDTGALAKKDKYTIFFGGNHSITDIFLSEAPENTLVIIKDSFAHSIAPFFLEHYDRVIMIDLRYYNKSLGKYLKEVKNYDLLVLYSTQSFAEDVNVTRLLR